MPTSGRSELAVTRIAADPQWRTTYASSVAIAPIQFGRGTFEWKLVDETDANLADDNADPARLYGIGRTGTAVRIYSVLLLPNAPPTPTVAPAPASWRWEVNP